MTIKDLKDLIKDLPDNMLVKSCCDNGGDYGTTGYVTTETRSDDNWETEYESDYFVIKYS